MTKLVALLPMKAHSERIPNKNFRDIAGKPLFRWMLDTLLSIESVDRVVINTDARTELAACGLDERERVTIRDRRPELCGDLVSMNRVLRDDVDATDADLYLMTHVTNPLIRAATVARALDRFEDADADSLFSVTRVQTRFYRANGAAVNHDPKRLIRTQDLEPWFEENSCIYLFTRDGFLGTNARIGTSPVMFETPRLESIDIDEPDDWTLAEALLARRASQE